MRETQGSFNFLKLANRKSDTIKSNCSENLAAISQDKICHVVGAMGPLELVQWSNSC